MIDDFERVLDGFVKPRRPQLAEVLACVTDTPVAHVQAALAACPPRAWNRRFHRSELWNHLPALERMTAAPEAPQHAREAWERLAARDLIPVGWLADPDRVPESLELALSLAADPVGVETAEALGAEVVHRLSWCCDEHLVTRKWRLNVIQPIHAEDACHDWEFSHSNDGSGRMALRWKLKTRWLASGGGFREKLDLLHAFYYAEECVPWLCDDPAVNALDKAVEEAAMRRGLAEEVYNLPWVCEDIRHAIEWRFWSERGHRTPDGTRLGDLASPFEPRLALWELGYGFCAPSQGCMHLGVLTF
jgi:hypothetical protein